MQKRTHDFATLVPLIVTIGKDVGADVLAAYIYDKLTDGGQRKQRRDGPKLTIRVNHKETEVTPEGFRKAIEESIEVQIENRDE